MLTQNTGVELLFSQERMEALRASAWQVCAFSGGQLMLTQNTGVELLFSQKRMEALRASNSAGVRLMVGSSCSLKTQGWKCSFHKKEWSTRKNGGVACHKLGRCASDGGQLKFTLKRKMYDSHHKQAVTSTVDMHGKTNLIQC